MAQIRIVDVTTEEAFALVPPCADDSFDHRTCDYWEDAVAGSKARRPAWFKPRREASAAASSASASLDASANPFAPARSQAPANPFAPSRSDAPNPFASADTPDLFAPVVDNPFAPTPRRVEGPVAAAPRKLALLARSPGVFGSYARVLLVDGQPAAYCQFGPLSAYPRALQLRELYPQLPASPLPAVITCIATTADQRREGYALRLVDDVCRELARRGFAAVETYPEAGAPENATSAAVPAFWERAGFSVAVEDERYPVMRREL
ncbi:MAG: hypothetical protein M0Z49_00930 [Chloroflexi bacterium]|nr:hypothetical protein [Chloroflexota bacterium]